MGYRCTKCGGRSVLTKWGWAPMIAILLVTVIFGDLIVPIRALWVAVGAVAALLVMWLFLRLHAAEGGEPPDPNA
jgi:energy-coupling factor transporter transmembrane protein EcfT